MNNLPVTSQSLVLYDTVDLGKQSVVPSHAHIISGMYPCPNLANQNATSLYLLTCKYLYTSPLAGAIPSIPRTPNAFLVCHDSTS